MKKSYFLRFIEYRVNVIQDFFMSPNRCYIRKLKRDYSVLIEQMIIRPFIVKCYLPLFKWFSRPLLKYMSIGALDLSFRSCRCLMRAGIRTVGDIVKCGENLLAIRNLGEKCCTEIYGKLYNLSIELPLPSIAERYHERYSDSGESYQFNLATLGRHENWLEEYCRIPAWLRVSGKKSMI